MKKHHTLTLGLLMSAMGAAAQPAEPKKWTPQIAVEAKPGNKRDIGEVDFLMPVHQSSNTLVFANIRARFDDANSHEGNFGLGLRQMQPSGWNLGTYAYFDRRRSPNEHYYSQATLGLEALGPNLDFRANAYQPTGTKERVTENSTAGITGGSVQVSTDIKEERALKGFDIEAGWRLPFFDREATQQLRVYAGGYRFTDELFTVQGPRFRAEYAFEEVPLLGRGSRIYLGLETQDDKQRERQTFASLRLNVPFGRAGSERRLTAQERRMTAPIVRDVDIVTQASTTTVTETATTDDGQKIVVLDATTTGNLNSALHNAGQNSTVLLSGTFNTNYKTHLRAGQTVMGKGTVQLRTPSGRTTTISSTGATINSSNIPVEHTQADGGNAAITWNDATVVMGRNSTLRGMTINASQPHSNADTQAKRSAVAVPFVDGVSLIDNTIHLVGGGDGGRALYIWGNNASVDAKGHLIRGNKLSNDTVPQSNVQYLTLRDNVKIQAGSTGNTATGPGFCHNMNTVYTDSNRVGFSSLGTGTGAACQ